MCFSAVRPTDDYLMLHHQGVVRSGTTDAPLLVFDAEIVKLFDVVLFPYFERDLDGLGRRVGARCIGALLFHPLQKVFCRSVAR